MARSAESAAREKVRARSKRRLAGQRGETDECLSGHPVFAGISPAYELGRIPEGGGYPEGLIELAGERMGMSAGDYHGVVHLCSGSVRAARTFDLRCGPGCGCMNADCGVAVPKTVKHFRALGATRRLCRDQCEFAGTGPSCLADVRRLPIATGSVRYVMADPPYEVTYAERMWKLGKEYPTPAVLLGEAARILAPGGRVALLHHVVPAMPAGLTRVGVYGVTTGPGYRIRALTVAERDDDARML